MYHVNLERKMTEQGHTLIVLLCRLIDDSTMLQAAEIKHSDTAVSAATDEHIHAVCAESNIVDLLVVCD